ncbi:L-fuculokinase [Vibrio albus]|uniref:L-fuculokinase n=1 Tax=Vibrio albus TaxID=2200953 RepID=A0A2U3B6M5_9VIBR|nr:L-fuculokinase [Vibrio albus]PWI32440.1 L-fuculokinase [Vibrio albus]
MSIVLILDCGATNVRAIAIDERGEILAGHHIVNETRTQLGSAEQQIWDIDQIWGKLTECSQAVTAQLSGRQVDGVTVTTFGVDGAPFDSAGRQLYPVISWKCPRTEPVLQRLGEYLDKESLYLNNGIGSYSFNTLFKLLWLKENEPDVYRKMDKFVFISSMLNQRLTSNWSTDLTMAGTSMMTDLIGQGWHASVLDTLGIDQRRFPEFVAAGERVGQLQPQAAELLGLTAGIPVISAGHDTQFALFGSGAALNQPVLSSGTWEILMARVNQVSITAGHKAQGVTTEWDALHGHYNPGIQWLGSGVLEWLSRLLFAELEQDPKRYQKMIAEGSSVAPGSGGVRFAAPLTSGRGPDAGLIDGFSIQTTRGQLYRSALEATARQTRNALAILEQLGGFDTDSLLVVGGGSKNALWNQIRADITGKPIDVVSATETTALGAAMFAFSGLGVYASPQQAQQSMRPQVQRILPGEQQADYQRLYAE